MGVLSTDDLEHVGSHGRSRRFPRLGCGLVVDVRPWFLRGRRGPLVVVAAGAFGPLWCRADGEPFARHRAPELLRGPRAPGEGGRGRSRRREIPRGSVGGGGGVGAWRAGLLDLPRCGQWHVDLLELTAQLDYAPGDCLVRDA